ncbi:MAG: matrixin family metalloprotease, partial [Planctomycetota bacterium]|nr:matrixin family metalloprotease [Planctomycetota bacterium]
MAHRRSRRRRAPGRQHRRRSPGQHQGCQFRPRSLLLEPLEDRRLLAVDIVFDYSLDTVGFFSAQERKDALERAAEVLEARLEDELTAITPGGSNTWTAVISHPETGNQHDVVDLTIPADTLLVFVGARNISNLGIGGPGGYQVSGTSQFVNNMVTRGQSGIATGSGDSSTNTDFAPWGGNVVFDSDASWNYSTDPPAAGVNDFYSVAVHEIAHLLGIGTSHSWTNQINASGQFAGTHSVQAHGSPIALDPTDSHWASGTDSTLPGTIIVQETALDPEITVGTRKELTTLDWAALQDVGWEVAPVSFAPTLDSISDFIINDNASERVVNLAGITAGAGESQVIQITASSSDPSVVPNPTVTYTSPETTGTLRFTPVADQSGTSTITVTLEDGGADNNLATTADNDTFSRSFLVTVSLSFDITFDYSLDSAGFFADQARKDALERAANVFENRLEDNLAAIQPSGSNTWTAVINHPETGNTENIVDLVIPIDTLTVFVGSRVMSNLGIGGSGGYQVSGTSAFVNTMSTRGQSGIATGSGDSSTNTDFAPWGGSLAFSRDASWNFSTDAPTSGTNDFYSTAIHELAHLLGFGRADSWDNLVNGSDEFAGTSAVAAHGSTIPLSGTKSHWASSTTSTLPGTTITQETAMDPGLAVGTRKEFTTLDWAALDDIGWEVTAPNQAPTLDAIGNLSIAEDAVQQTVNLASIGPGPDESEAVRITASSSNPGLVPDPTVNYTNGNATGTLTFTPMAEQNGTATITVTVEDAGDDGDLNETDDNL